MCRSARRSQDPSTRPQTHEMHTVRPPSIRQALRLCLVSVLLSETVLSFTVLCRLNLSTKRLLSRRGSPRFVSECTGKLQGRTPSTKYCKKIVSWRRASGRRICPGLVCARQPSSGTLSHAHDACGESSSNTCAVCSTGSLKRPAAISVARRGVSYGPTGTPFAWKSRISCAIPLVLRDSDNPMNGDELLGVDESRADGVDPDAVLNPLHPAA